jgi:hypothetical protein
MGKGIAILFYIIMLPTTGILILTWIVTYIKWKKHTAFFVLLSIWGLFTFLTGLLWFSAPYFRPMILTQKDITGNYIIDRDKFPGKQADWQYENFRFSITDNNELIFESRIYDNKWKADTVKVSYSSGYYDIDRKEYCNRKLRVHSDSTNHHIIRDNPTLYRQSFNDFYYVFESIKFGNVFFKKGQWKN